MNLKNPKRVITVLDIFEISPINGNDVRECEYCIAD